MGLMALATFGDTCTKNRLDFIHMYDVAYNQNAEANAMPLSPASDLVKMNAFEKELNKTVAPEKVRNIMSILRRMGSNSADEIAATIVSILYKIFFL